MTDILTETRWPHLRKLRLQDANLHTLRLKPFLGAHATTLKELDFDSVPFDDRVIDPPSNEMELRSVVVDFFVFLREKLRLDNFRLNRYFGLHTVEYFKANNEVGTTNTRLQAISDFVCHKAAFPFPGCAEIFGHHEWGCGGLADQHECAAYTSVPPEATSELQGLPLCSSDVMKMYTDESWSLLEFEDDDLMTLYSDSTDEENGDFQPSRTESDRFDRITLAARLAGNGLVDDI